MKPLDLDADIVELVPAPRLVLPATPLREMAYRADAWTPQESERLRALFLEDTAIADIALAPTGAGQRSPNVLRCSGSAAIPRGHGPNSMMRNCRGATAANPRRP